MTSMPLWLRYSSRRFTRLCRPSILVSRLLCRESQNGVRPGASGEQGCGPGAADNRAPPTAAAGALPRGRQTRALRLLSRAKLVCMARGFDARNSLFKIYLKVYLK